MPIKLTEVTDAKVLEVIASGKLTDEDYQQRFIPEIDRLTKQYGKIRLLFEMTEFHGWEPKAAWDDFKLNIKHRHDIDRVAMVGDKKWERWLTEFAKPFTGAKVKYFDQTEASQARAWVGENIVTG